jgi:COMPASS component SWD2
MSVLPVTLPLSEAVLRSFHLGRLHNGGPAAAAALLQPEGGEGAAAAADPSKPRAATAAPGRINSLDFHRTSDLLVTASDDGVLAVYDCESGERTAAAGAGRAGCACVAWTHAPTAVVYAANPAGGEGGSGGAGGGGAGGAGGAAGGGPYGGGAYGAGAGAAGGPNSASSLQHDPHALRYHSLHDNRLVRSLPGHRERVTCVAVSPRSDAVLSSSQDKTVRLWDLRAPHSVGLLQTPAHPTAAFDHQGLVFAVGSDAGVIKLYDASEYARGPFDAFAVPDLRASPVPFSHLRFSPDGKRLLAVAEGRIFVLDAFTGAVVQRLSNGTPEAGSAPEACFTPDGEAVMSGCEDGAVRLWRAGDGRELACLRSHVAAPMCARFSPRRLVAATACHALALWLPGVAEAGGGGGEAGGAAAAAAPARPTFGSGAAAAAAARA